jgi:hypothetical protein
MMMDLINMVHNVDIPINEIPANLRPKPEGETTQDPKVLNTPQNVSNWAMSGVIQALWPTMGVFIKPFENTYKTYMAGNPEVPKAFEQCLDVLGIPCPFPVGGNGMGVGCFLTVGTFSLAIYAAVKKDMEVKHANTKSGGISPFSPNDFKPSLGEQGNPNGSPVSGTPGN